MLGEIGVPQKIFPGFCLDVCWCFHPKNYRCPTVLCGYGFLQSLWTPCLKRWTAINFQLFWCENSGIPLVFPPLPSNHWKTNGVQAKTVSEVRWTSRDSRWRCKKT
jgi:hypothetical protein